jgi:hypothetical protein
MSKEAILGTIRHLLTFGGGVLVSRGTLDEVAMTEAVGAVVTLVGIVWSIRQKKQSA